jgi:DNA-binding beta-propeller fold protein YncE
MAMSRRPRLIAGLVAAVVALVGLLLPWPGPVVGLVDAGPTSATPTLPEQFATFSRFTAGAADLPAGRAIALYEYGSSELFTTWQTLVAGADRDTYRQLPTVSQVLLSPDGTQVLRHDHDDEAPELTLLSLVSGQTRTVHTVPFHSNVGAGLQLLDWSADGRYVAYAVPAPPPADGTAESSIKAGRAIEELAILDLANDTTVRYPRISPVWGAVFDPSGQELLVQTVQEGQLVSLAGEVIRPVQLPIGAEVGRRAFWSPDGSRVAVIVDHVGADSTVSFVDVASGRPLAAELDVWDLLGWRTPTTVLARVWIADRHLDAIVEVSIVDGRRSVLSTFSNAQSCEFGMRQCAPYRIQLARGLIGSIGTRPSYPDRGPVPPAIGIGWAVTAGLAAGLVTLLVLRLARARSLRRSATPGEPARDRSPSLASL